MPNIVSTRCTVTGPAADVAAFRNRMFVSRANDDGEVTDVFDFNNIIRRPELLDYTEESSHAIIGGFLVIARRGGNDSELVDEELSQRIRAEVEMPDAPWSEVAAAYLANNPEYEQAGRLRHQAYVETGYGSWYPWNIANWGTEWNAGSFGVFGDDPLEFYFETVSDFPEPVFVALSREFPTLHFRCAVVEDQVNFGGDGYFNAPDGENEWSRCEVTAELVRHVFGGADSPDPDRNEEAEPPYAMPEADERVTYH